MLCSCVAVALYKAWQSMAKHGKAQLQSTVHDLMCMTTCFANLIIYMHSCWSAGAPAETSCFGCSAGKGTVTHVHACKCHTSCNSASIQHRLPQCLCRHSLQDECRILLLHGLLHLLGHDHELGDSEAESMAQQEQDIMQKLSWKARICYAAVVFPCLWSVACRLSCEVVSWNHS